MTSGDLSKFTRFPGIASRLSSGNACHVAVYNVFVLLLVVSAVLLLVKCGWEETILAGWKVLEPFLGEGYEYPLRLATRGKEAEMRIMDAMRRLTVARRLLVLCLVALPSVLCQHSVKIVFGSCDNQSLPQARYQHRCNG